jgi:hypothetical protein
LSSFKTHLKKHGLDPDEYPGLPKRDNPLVEVWQMAEPQETKEAQVSDLRDLTFNPEISLPDLPDTWDPFLSIPVDPCKSAIFLSSGSVPHDILSQQLLWSCSLDSLRRFPTALQRSWPRPPGSHRLTTPGISYHPHDRPRCLLLDTLLLWRQHPC